MTKKMLLRLIEIFGPEAKLADVQATLELLASMGEILRGVK